MIRRISSTSPTAAAAASGSSARHFAHFTPESPLLERLAKAHGFHSTTWFDETDLATLRRGGYRLKRGQQPLTTTVIKPLDYFNVGQLAAVQAPAATAVPYNLDTNRPIGGLVAAALVEAAEQNGFQSLWWAPSGTRHELVNTRTRPTRIYTEITMQIANIDQFEDPAAVKRDAIILGGRAVMVKSKRYNHLQPLSDAIVQHDYGTGHFLTVPQMRRSGFKLRSGAEPVFLPPSFKMRDRLTLFNLDEIENSAELSRALKLVANEKGWHMDAFTGKPLWHADEGLGHDADAFASRFWIFKKDLEYCPVKAVVREGCAGRLFLPRSWAETYGMHLYNADELVDPVRAFATSGFALPGLWATKLRAPPQHLQSLLAENAAQVYDAETDPCFSYQPAEDYITHSSYTEPAAATPQCASTTAAFGHEVEHEGSLVI